MRKFAKHSTNKFLVFALMMCSLWACSDNIELTDETQDVPEMTGEHTCVLYLNGQRLHYSNEADTRTTTIWADQSKIYLTLDTDNGKVRGTAIYTQSSDSWIFNYNGTLNVDKASQCNAYYIENGIENNAGIQLSASSAIYEDTEGQYIYSGNVLSVSANLKPKTGRMRFKGESNDSIFVKGITHYTYFHFGSTSFSTSTEELFLATKAEGQDTYYTPYVYGYFTNEKSPALQVTAFDQAYERTFGTDIFKAGESGYITIPNSLSSNNWTSSNPFFKLNYSASATQKQKDAINQFIDNMVKVEGGIFWMGAQKVNDEAPNYDINAFDEESPVHQVILAPFYMGKYEVTNELYDAVMSKTSDYAKKKPFTSRYLTTFPSTSFPSDLQSFLTTLNELTGLKFDIPTEEEWEYAARGGRKTHYYTYAGSNTLEYVANTSGYNYYEIGTYTANELGIYDMTGNCSELCYYRDKYTNLLTINPQITTTYCGRGCDYSNIIYQNNTYARITNRTQNHFNGIYPGLRLILRIN